MLLYFPRTAALRADPWRHHDPTEGGGSALRIICSEMQIPQISCLERYELVIRARGQRRQGDMYVTTSQSHPGPSLPEQTLGLRGDRLVCHQVLATDMEKNRCSSLDCGCCHPPLRQAKHLGEGVKWLVTMLFPLLLIFCFSGRCEDCQNPEVPPLRKQTSSRSPPSTSPQSMRFFRY